MLWPEDDVAADALPAITIPSGAALKTPIAAVAAGDPLFDGTEHDPGAGVSALEIIEAALRGAAAPREILNISCGDDGITRMLREQFPAAALTVCDPERRAAGIGAQEVRAARQFRDLQLDGRFDLIWAGSLPAHLPEDRTRQFFDFAVRHMGPGARLIFTSNGEHVAARLRETDYGLGEAAACGLIVQYLNDGYGYRGREDEPGRGVSLAARAWYERVVAGSHLQLEAFHARGWEGERDVLVLRSVHMAYGGRPSNLAEPFFDRAAPRDDDEVPGFDEAWYLHTFPDVAAAIAEGWVSSGRAHYRASGWKEGRPPFDPERAYGRHGEAGLNRATLRELGEAALRNLPFLPGEFVVDGDRLTISGYCAAPADITARMAFFVNGRKIEDVTYPIRDAPEARFADVPGMGLTFQARVPLAWEELQESRFLRFDAAATGRYEPADWRRAIHYMLPARERFAVPPAANMQRVIGDTSIARFAMGGATIFNNIASYLGEMGLGWTDFPNVLDWGCGAGRVTRYLIGETLCAVTGMDIDADNIGWCRETYAGGTFLTGPLRPPTALADGQFDLVLGLSVLTHLQERDQFLWLEELRRITRPGALLFLSVQGPTHLCYTRFPPHLYRRVQEEGFVDLMRDPALDGVIADPEYYRAALHTRPYIVRRWGEIFDVLEIADAIATPQDFVVLRRR